MNFKLFVAVLLIVISSHICIHEIVISIRILINAFNGIGRFTDALEPLVNVFMWWDTVSFDNYLKSAANGNNTSANYHILIRIMGLGALCGSIYWLFMLTNGSV